VGPVIPWGPVGPTPPVGPVGPCLTIGAGVVQTKAAVLRLLTIEIENQTVFVGLVGGAVVHPVGGVPVLFTKSQEPPVGVAGAVADSWKINHSKYVPPKFVELPYKPAVSELGEATSAPVGLLPYSPDVSEVEVVVVEPTELFP
jgi:hypothetical protein